MIKFYYFGASKKSKSEGRKERKEGGREERRENEFIWLPEVLSSLSPKTDSQYTSQVTLYPRKTKGEEPFGFHHRVAPYSL